MSRRWPWGTAIGGALASAGAVLASGCSDAGLQLQDGSVEYVDDEVAVEGSLCTSPSDDVVFPVKILFVIDQSASLQCTDPESARLEALAEVGAELDLLPHVEFGVVGFASWSRVTAFTSDWSEASAALAPADGQGGPATDYQGALASTLSMIEEDILQEGPAQTARTRYVVIFLSDGQPEPRCRAGCDDGDTVPDSLYGVCNTDAEIEDGDYVDMSTTCPEYNQDTQILTKVQDLLAMADTHGAGGLSLSTILLFADDDTVAEACPDIESYGYVRDEAEPLLQSMATEGLGTYRNVNTSADLDFLDLDYQSLEAPYSVFQLLAFNDNALPSPEGPRTDSDADGLSDDEEFELGTDRLLADSDGDGFGDLFEQRLLLDGLDPLEASVPAAGCDDRDDVDGDGLAGCEELWLRTDAQLSDTDGDRVPDGLEQRLGLDPTEHDIDLDHDLDGRTTRTELATGTHPTLYDDELSQLRQMVIDLDQTHTLEDGSQCYTLSVEGLRLVPTLSDDASLSGRNRIRVLFQEEPQGLSGSRGVTHAACVEARYLGDTYKEPADGRLDGVRAEDFVELAGFEPDEHCLPLTGDELDSGLHEEG